MGVACRVTMSRFRPDNGVFAVLQLPTDHKPLGLMPVWRER